MENQEQNISKGSIELLPETKENPGSFKYHPENINYGGRPKLANSITAWYQIFLDMPIDDLLAWESKNSNYPTAAGIALAGIIEARTKIKSRIEVTDRTEGRATQPLVHAVTDDISTILDSLDTDYDKIADEYGSETTGQAVETGTPL